MPANNAKICTMQKKTNEVAIGPAGSRLGLYYRARVRARARVVVGLGPG